VGSFDGGSITSDAGALLLRQTDRVIGLTKRLAACFHDRRCQELVEQAQLVGMLAAVAIEAWLRPKACPLVTLEIFWKNVFGLINQVAPDEEQIVIFKRNTVRLEKAGLVNPFDLTSKILSSN
jgi:Transposase DDE domain group 1